MAVALMVAAMLTASVNTALAETVYTEHEYGVTSVIDVPGKTMIRLVLSSYKGSDYYSGKANRFQVAVHTGSFSPTTGLPIFKIVSAYEDNPTRNAFSVGLGTAQVQNLVKPWQIQIVRMCNTTIAYWTIPMVAPATGGSNPTPEVTLPPGMLVVRRYGEAMAVAPTPPTSIGTTGWKYSIPEGGIFYIAEATLFCPGWRYCGPVGEAYAGTPLRSTVRSQTWIWTHP
jgi:hypothetical protein